MQRPRPRRIAVLMGGISNEREVSLKSGKAVAAALQERGHRAFPLDITAPTLEALDGLEVDLVFVALHGWFGEDGQVQRLLDERGLPYTGSGVEASRTGMDKIASKRCFLRHAVPTADYLVISPEHGPREVQEQAEHLGYPLVCKPGVGGSSLGVSIVRSDEELTAALAKARGSGAEGGAVLLERYVHGRELTVGVLDGEPLPLVEIVSRREFFDYQAKYAEQSTEYIIPVALLESLYRRAQQIAVRAYAAIGCRHMARVDMIHGYDGSLQVLEVNTIPGFTPRSLLPMAAEHAGIGFPQLCDRIAHMALRDAGGAAADGGGRGFPDRLSA